MKIPFELSHTFARSLPGMVRPSRGEEQPQPQVVIVNEALAAELGLDVDWLRSPAGIEFLLGRSTDEQPHAMAYAGYQFGQFNPSMGDGRALLLGEIENDSGRWDLHAKGTGPTPYSRLGSDGRGTLRSMLREYLFSEAMHALGIPTTRSLAVISTGRKIQRQMVEEAGVLVRVAASHIRIGSFHYAAQTGQLEDLANYTIARHYPGSDYKELYSRAMDAQIATVAAWQHVGFIHGVMNTDNTTLSGQTIDYGPCAFMEAYDPDTWFSSIDAQGRYRFRHQPEILGWNFARLAESMLPLFDASSDAAITYAQETINGFYERFEDQRKRDFQQRFGLEEGGEYFAALAQSGADFTLANQGLAKALHGEPDALGHLLRDCSDAPDTSFLKDYRKRASGAAAAAVPPLPRVIPRPHNVEAALLDLDLFQEFLHAVTHPTQPNEKFETPGDTEGYLTYCGT